jgi:hypothetical protein
LREDVAIYDSSLLGNTECQLASAIPIAEASRGIMDEDSTFLQRLETEFARYPEFPEEVRDWVINAIQAKKSSWLLTMLQENPDNTIKSLDDFFGLMRQILKCDNKSLMCGTDFNSADLDPERLDAMIAELRGVGFLHDQGFADIKLLSASQKERGADIRATHMGTRYAVEVVCSSRTAYRYPDHKRRSSDLIEWIADKFHEKQDQLNQTAVEEGCAKRALVVVLNSYPALQLETRHEYIHILTETWNRLKKPQAVHLAIVTGMVKSGVGLDDCVFPGWSANP